MSSKAREKAKKVAIREAEIQKKSEYLISKGWRTGTYEYPDIPGGFMYRIAPEGGGNDIVKTLCQATKLQCKWDSNRRI